MDATLHHQSYAFRSPQEKQRFAELYSSSTTPITFSTSLGPGPTYMAPNVALIFSSCEAEHLEGKLPDHISAQWLLARYWTSVHPVARLLHRSSFQKKFDAYWDDIDSERVPARSLQALVFAVLLSGVVSTPETDLEPELGRSKKYWIERLQTGTEEALSTAKMMATTKVETLQALVVYLVRQCFLFACLFFALSFEPHCESGSTWHCAFLPYTELQERERDQRDY